MKPSLESLFDRYRRKGDIAALGKIFDRTSSDLLRVALHVASHAAEAEDLVQETYLTAIAKAESFDDNRPLTPWLLGILRNHARRAKRKRSPLILDRADGTSETRSETQSISLSWNDRVSKAVSTLPNPYRQVLVLRVCHDKSPAEIAVLLDRTPATVRSQISRGLERLRKLLPNERGISGLVLVPTALGLSNVRNSVLAKATLASQMTSVGVAASSIAIGGLIVSKSTLVVAALVVAALGAGTYLITRPSIDSDNGSVATVENNALNSPTENVESPTLVGATPSREGEVNAESTEPVASKEKTGADPWPPKRPIPTDKGSVAGTILFEDGTPLVGARIALWGQTEEVCVTDERGRYHLHAERVGERSPVLRLEPGKSHVRNTLVLSEKVEMRAGVLVLHDFKIQRGLTLSATVVDAETQEPLENSRIAVRRVPYGPGQAEAAFTSTNSNGHFEIPYLPRAKYAIEIEHDGRETLFDEIDSSKTDFPSAFSLRRANGLTIQFENLPVAAWGQPLSFSFAKFGPPSVNGQPRFTSKKGVVGDDGRLVIDSPPPGTYQVSVYGHKVLARATRRITILPKKPTTVKWSLPPTSVVSGVLRNHKGKSLAGYRVRVKGTRENDFSDKDGDFTLSGVKHGTHGLEVYAGTAWVRVAMISVGKSDSTNLDVRVSGNSTLKGRWLIGDQPVSTHNGTGFLTRKGDTALTATVLTDVNGEIRIDLLEEGDYQLALRAGPAVPKTVDVHVPADGEVSIGDVVSTRLMRVPVSLLGIDFKSLDGGINGFAFSPSYRRVRSPSKHPASLSATDLAAMNKGEMIRIRVVQDARGQTLLEGVPPGQRRLELYDVRRVYRAEIDVDVTDGMTEPIEILFAKTSDGE